MNWFTIKETQLVWAPVGTYVNKKGETKTKFIKLGVKATMMDGSWWFHSYKHGSWTKHWPLVQKFDRLGRPAVEGGNPAYLPERKDKYTERELHKEWGSRKPELVAALQKSLFDAESEGDTL